MVSIALGRSMIYLDNVSNREVELTISLVERREFLCLVMIDLFACDNVSDILEWCIDNCANGFRFKWNAILFMDVRDAVHFQLTWC
jgi:hypothetical protein